MTKAYADMPGGWKWLTGDMSWEDYGGSWFKPIKGTHHYFVVRYENGHEHDKELPRHMVSVVSVNLDEMDEKRLNDVLKCCGYRIDGDEIVSESGDVLAARSDSATWDHVLVEAALAHGAYAPHDDFSGDTRLASLRKQARDSANALIRDAALLKASLNRPVNKIGSTAAEFARGDIDSALNRGPFDDTKNLMRHLHGKAPRFSA